MRPLPLVAVALFATVPLVLGAEPSSKAELRWKGPDLVLRMQFINSLAEVLWIKQPHSIFTRHAGSFGSLRIQVFSPDGTDQTEMVFTNERPRPVYYSEWSDGFEAHSPGVCSFSFANDLRVDPGKLPKPGWKLRIKLVGYTDAQDAKLKIPITPGASSAALGENLWEPDRSRKILPAEDVTVLLESTLTVPSK